MAKTTKNDYGSGGMITKIEAARIAYRDRDAILADPETSYIPIKKWLSREYAASQAALIDRSRRMPNMPPTELANHEDTVYLTIVDNDRNAVSFINTLFFPFGSSQVAPQSGIILHN